MTPKSLFTALHERGVQEQDAVSLANLLHDFQQQRAEFPQEDQRWIETWLPRRVLYLLEFSLTKARPNIFNSLGMINVKSLRRPEAVPVIIEAFAPLLVSPKMEVAGWTMFRKTFEHRSILKHAGSIMDEVLSAMEESVDPKEKTASLARLVHDSMAYALEVAIAANGSDRDDLLSMVPEFVERNARIERFHPRPSTPQTHHQQRFERFASLVAAPAPPSRRPRP